MHHPREGRSGVCHPTRISTGLKLERNRTPRCAPISLTRPSLVNEFLYFLAQRNVASGLFKKVECCVRLIPKAGYPQLWIAKSKYSTYSTRIEGNTAFAQFYAMQFYADLRIPDFSESILRPPRPAIRTKAIQSLRLGGHSLSRPFPNHRFPVHRQARQLFHQSGGPANYDSIDARSRSKAEVQSRITCGQIAAIGADLVDLL